MGTIILIETRKVLLNKSCDSGSIIALAIDYAGSVDLQLNHRYIIQQLIVLQDYITRWSTISAVISNRRLVLRTHFTAADHVHLNMTQQ